MMDTGLPTFKRRLLDELTGFVEDRATDITTARVVTPERSPRFGLALKIAAAAAVAVGAITFVSTRDDDRAAASFSLSTGDDGVIVVSFDSGFDDGEGLEAQLREAGVDVEVTTTPVSPSLVGRALVVIGTSDILPQPGIEYSDLALTIDRSELDGPIRMEIGVAADVHQTAGNAFDPRELFDGLPCAFPAPLMAPDLAAAADDIGVNIEWTVLTPVPIPAADTSPPSPDVLGPPPEWTMHGEVVADVPPGEVLFAYAASVDLVRVDVIAEDADVPAGFEAELGSTPCTAERAARWE